MATITAAFGEPVKQYAGQVQVTRSVRVKAPGKFFNNLACAHARVGQAVALAIVDEAPVR